MNRSLRLPPAADSPAPPEQQNADRLRVLICQLRWMGVAPGSAQFRLAMLKLRTGQSLRADHAVAPGRPQATPRLSS